MQITSSPSHRTGLQVSLHPGQTLSALIGLVKKTSSVHSFGYIEICRGASKAFLVEPQAAPPRSTVLAIEENAQTLPAKLVSRPPRLGDLRI